MWGINRYHVKQQIIEFELEFWEVAENNSKTNPFLSTTAKISDITLFLIQCEGPTNSVLYWLRTREDFLN